MRFTLVENDGFASVTVLSNGELLVATNEHPNFKTIVACAIAGEYDGIEDLFDVSRAVAKKFEKHSERVSIANGQVYFDGEIVDNALTKQILRFMEDGVEDFKPLVNFFEKIAVNPNPHSREQLFRWLQNHDFPIDADGDIIAYKGVRKDGAGNYTSISQGPAIVNGESVRGYVPNPLGAIVEMPRNTVEFDPAVGCSSGLHAGTWSYASGFAQGAVLKVKINPRDVVSVPTDCADQKVRVCRYTVLEVTEQEIKSSFYALDEDVYEDENYAEFAPDSSLIASVWWENGTMNVELHSGVDYDYEGVPYDVFTDFRDASSAGQFYNANIRGRYNEG